MPRDRRNARARVVLPALALAVLATAPVAHACSVSATSLVFGSIDPLLPMHTDSTAVLTVQCPTPSDYSVSVTPGGGTYAGRDMASGTGMLRYQLYVDASRLSVWGDGTGGTVMISGSADASGSTHTVYGRVPHQPFARPGVYTDSLIVTVSF